jgi:preprotein translocase subunit Sec63
MESTMLVMAIASLVVGIIIPILVYKWMKKRTEEIYQWTQSKTIELLEYIVNLVPASAVDPQTVRRLLDDYNRTREWRGKVSRRPDGGYRIEWTP